MSALYTVLPLLGQLLVLGLLFAILLGRWVGKPLTRHIVLAVLLALSFTVPIAGSTLAQWLRSAVGDLSVFTLVVFADSLRHRWSGHGLLGPHTREWLLRSVAVVGVVFYPLALGVSAIDPFRWGYAPVALVGVLCIASLVSWLLHARQLAVLLLLPLLAYNLGMLESDNLWSYLIDPVLVVYALVQVFLDNLSRKKQDNRL